MITSKTRTNNNTRMDRFSTTIRTTTRNQRLKNMNPRHRSIKLTLTTLKSITRIMKMPRSNQSMNTMRNLWNLMLLSMKTSSLLKSSRRNNNIRMKIMFKPTSLRTLIWKTQISIRSGTLAILVRSMKLNTFQTSI